MKKTKTSNIKKVTLEQNLTRIDHYDKNKKLMYSKYEISFHNKYINTRRVFTTQEEAYLYKRICDDLISKARISKLTVHADEKDLLEYPETLLLQLEITPDQYANYYTEIVPNFEQNYNKAKTILTLREEKILNLRFKNLLTLEEIGKSMSITRERVRQIEIRAIKKLKHFSTKDIFIKGTEKLELISKAEREELYEKIKSEMTYEIALEIVKKHDEELRNLNHFVGTMDIEELDLSVRSYNCLKRANLTKVADLIKLTRDDLIRVRNLGKKSAKEIRERLADYGLCLKGEEY